MISSSCQYLDSNSCLQENWTREFVKNFLKFGALQHRSIWHLLNKCQIDGEYFVIFCGLPRKHEL